MRSTLALWTALALVFGALGCRDPEPPASEVPDVEVRGVGEVVDAELPTGQHPEPEPEPPIVPEAPGEPDPFADWQTYRHPLGGSFRYPPGWRLAESLEGLRLEPPGFDVNEELILVLAAPAPGITAADDPAVVAELDAQVALTMPGLRRRGSGESVAWSGGEGHSFDYRGHTPDGTRAEARVWIAIHEGTSVGFTLLASEARFDERAPTVEEIFSTLAAAAEGEAIAGDPSLVGVFSGEAIASGAGVYVNTQLVYVFNPDGTLLSGAQSFLNASQRDVDGNLRWTADGQTEGSVDTGCWSAGGNLVRFDWDDGTTATFRYGFEPDGTLVLRNPLSGELVDFYARVR